MSDAERTLEGMLRFGIQYAMCRKLFNLQEGGAGVKEGRDWETSIKASTGRSS